MTQVSKDNVEEILPLLPGQNTFFSSLPESGSSRDLEQGVWRLDGRLDPELLQRAWSHLVDRHPTLRTVFFKARKQPVQLVLKSLPVPLAVAAPQRLAPEEQRAELKRFLAADLEESVEAFKGPLLRASVLRLGDEAAWLVLTYHPLILDGRSLPLLVADLLALYEALDEGRALPAAEPSPLKVFFVWLKRQATEELLDFWAFQLEGFENPTPLPVDRHGAPEAGLPDAAAGERRPASWRASLGAGTSGRLEALARRRGTEAAVFAQAAWALLLARYSGEEDVVFGLTVSGRQVELTGVERLIGPFANTLPVRVAVDEREALPELLHSLQQLLVNLHHNGHVSLADIRSKSRIPAPLRLFASRLTFHEDRFYGETACGETAEPPPNGRPLRLFPGGERARLGGDVDLEVDVWPGEIWQVALSYDPEVFDAATVEQLGTSFRCLLDGMAANPETRLSDLEMLLPAQRERLQAELDRKTEACGLERLAPEIFEDQVREHPDAVALTCGEHSLSYTELNQQANRLARWLLAHGVGRDSRVGLFGERSAGMMVTILGVLKAGAAWVPLDPGHPDERVAKVLSSGGLAVVATQGGLASRLSALVAELAPTPAIYCWDTAPAGSGLADAASLAGDGAENPSSGIGPDDLAYVFFTSGSTGEPKGAMVTHKGMVNHLWAKIDLLGLTAESVTVQNASHGFDIFVWQLLAPLLSGGRVVVYTGDAALDPAVMIAAVEDDGVTILEVVPSLLDALLDEVARQRAAGEPRGWSRLKFLLSTGEALPVPLARRWFEFFEDVPIVNAFGPTECSDDTMHHLLTAAPPAAAPRVPVGRVVPGFAIYVLDRHLRVLPRGCPGQLAMAGIGVGRGYLGAPATTAQAFVPDPFADKAGERLYMSGDLGCLKGDGVLEFLGRIDSQVKVRGHRIELGEVEAALVRHPAVRQGVVVCPPGGEQRLVGYFVAGGPLEVAELRTFLEDALPPAMVPEQLVRLDAMPLNRSGKIDRKALPEPSAPERADFVAPRNEMEAQIAEIWQELLEVPKVSVHDNFFELGGHSLVALRVRSRISYHQGVDLPLSTILDHARLEDLAREVQALLDRTWVRDGAGTGIPVLPEAEHYPLSHAQRLLYFQQQLDPDDSSFNLAELLLLEGALDLEVLKRALTALVERHAGFRTSFVVVDGEVVQRIEPEVEAPLAFVDVSQLAGDEQEVRLEAFQQEEIHTPFDLGKTPWRGRLFKLAEGRHLLILVLHHTVTDLLSGELMLRDLKELYRAFSAGESPSLPSVPIRYVDYAAWQSERLRRGELAAAEQYWTEKLAGELPVLDIPDRRSRPPQVASHRSEAVSVPVDEAVAGRLRQLADEHETTFFATLLAAANAFLSRITGATDILHGTPSANRTHLDTEEVLGFFVNMLPLRTNLEGDPTFLEILERTRQTVVEAFTHEEYPFELLVRKLNPQREIGRFPIFSTMFAVIELEPSSPAPISPDLTVRPHPRTAEWTMEYDFALAFTEGDEGLTCGIAYKVDFFERSDMERLVRRFQRLLGGIATNPRQRLSALPLLSEEDLRRLRLQPLAQRELYSLSISQQDVWFQYQILPETQVYNLCLRVDLRGPLESSTLQAAVQAVIDRQAILRSSFTVVDGRPFQRIAAQAEVGWTEEDLAALEPEVRREKLEAWEREIAETPFDVESGPLYRFALARLASSEHRLLLVMRDLILDEPGVVDFLRQTFEAYAERAGGATEPLPELKLCYTDFAEHQQARREARLLGPQRAYWHRQLEGALPGFELPTDRPHAASSGFEAHRVELRLPPERLDALVGQGRGDSLFHTVLAALKLLFFRLSGRHDIVVGLSVSNQPPELAQVLGRFTHVWPLRTRFGARESFGELVLRLERTIGEMVQHADVSFHEVLAELAVERDADRPLMPVAVAQAPAFESRSGDLRVVSRAPAPREVLFELLPVVHQRPGELQVVFFYQSGLFDRVTVERLAESLDALLEDVVAHPETHTTELAILSPAERRHVLVDCNRSATPVPRPHLAYELFEQRVAACPEAVAAVCGDEQVRYAELDARVESIAVWLRAQGVEREARVALFGERGIGMLAAILGILKSGAAFVPLDPKHPDERLRKILDLTSPSVLATQASFVQRSRKLAEATRSRPGLLCWDEVPAQPAAAGEVSAVLGNQLACVFFTSGSTGLPKGAMVEHAGMVNHLAAKVELLGLDERSVVAQNASHCFDISVWQFLAALLVGGRVAIYPDETALDPQEMLAAADRDGVTVLETVPSLLGAMLDVPALSTGDGGPKDRSQAPLERLTHLISNAETLPVDLSRRWFEHFPHSALVNTYGATECSDDTTHHVMREPLAEGTPRVLVGEPIPGVRHYVLDACLRPVPAGFAGQLAVAGVGVGRGYWGDPRQTAQSFVPSDFCEAPGGRLYLTGDLVRWAGEGVLDFLGRRDHQVKIRGFRVELGEIEAALYRHPAVSEAVVVMCETSGGPRPVAYVAPRPAAEPAVSELRAHLRQELPEYMVPAAFVVTSALPRTATGKVDRAALGRRPFPAPEARTEDARPRTPTEEVLAKVWTEVLELEHVGIHDGFFNLGGDSIMSIRVASLAQKQGLEIAARDFYLHQTIAEQAAAVDSRNPAGPTREETVSAGDVPLTPIQHWFFEKDLVAPHQWNVSLMFTLTERMDPGRMEKAMRQVMAHHDAFRLRFTRGTSGWRAFTTERETSDFFHLFDLSALPKSSRRPALETLAAELQLSLNLAAGPLLRVAFFDLGRKASPRCLFLCHHLIMDAVSVEIVLEDFMSAYRQLEGGAAVELAPKTTSFQRWARLLEAHGRSPELRDELAYWLDRLPRHVPPLPVDPPRSDVWGRIGARRRRQGDAGDYSMVTVGLKADETKALLRQLPAAYGTQINDALLSALVEAMAGWTGKRALLVDFPNHGRGEVFENVDLSRTVGWLTTGIPLWLDLTDAATPVAALLAVKERLASLPRGGIGLGLLQYMSGDERIAEQLADLPRAQIIFQYFSSGGIPKDWPIRPAPESPGPMLSRYKDPSRDPLLLLVRATLLDGLLKVEWIHKENVHRRSTIKRLAQGHLEAIRMLLKAASHPEGDTARGR